MRRLLLLLLTLAPLACSGAQQRNDNDWTPEPQQRDRRLRETEALHAAQVDPIEARRTAPYGVRHDLMLAVARPEPRCPCLGVEVGPGNDKTRFFWLGSPADTGLDSLAVAIGARGVACPGGPPDDERRRPSISAVDQEGDDITIEVEDLPLGRPLATGAIIPKPGPKGAVYIRARRGNHLYGHTPNGARCRVR